MGMWLVIGGGGGGCGFAVRDGTGRERYFFRLMLCLRTVSVFSWLYVGFWCSSACRFVFVCFVAFGVISGQGTLIT